MWLAGSLGKHEQREQQAMSAGRVPFRTAPSRHAVHSKAAGLELRPGGSLRTGWVWQGKKSEPFPLWRVPIEDTGSRGGLSSSKDHLQKGVVLPQSLKVFCFASPLAWLWLPFLVPHFSCTSPPFYSTFTSFFSVFVHMPFALRISRKHPPPSTQLEAELLNCIGMYLLPGCILFTLWPVSTKDRACLCAKHVSLFWRRIHNFYRKRVRLIFFWS